MSVQLSPSNALGFNRPFTNSVKRILTISNNNAQPVAFKVKTTAPKLYCVRPNTGRIEPGDSIDVSVMLQQMKEEPPLSAKCKDKFLVQSTFITSEKETRGLQDIWNVAESNEEWKVHSQKLRVVYLPPEGQVLEEEEEGISREPSGIQYGISRENGHAPPVPSYGHEEDSPEQHRDVPERIFTPPPEPHVVQESIEERTIERSDSVGVVNVNVHHSNTPPPPAPAPASVNRELEEKYKEAQAEIQRLRALLAAVPDPSSIADNDSVAPPSMAPTELRRRHATSAVSEDGRSTYSSTDVGTMVDDHHGHQEGVPLQVVIIIALGVFVTTYLFF